MRKRTDAVLAIGSIALVTIVPTVLVLLPSGKDDPGDGGPLADPAAAQLNGPLQVPPTPTTVAQPPPTQPQGNSPLPPIDAGTPPPGGGTQPNPGPQLQKPSAYTAASTGATITGVKWVNKSKSQFDFTVKSPSLGKSVNVRVIVPKGYKRTAQRTWPTLYMFHGGNDKWVSWTRSTDIAAVASKWDTLVAMPEGGVNGSYVNWYNGGRGGNPAWETFHTIEVRELLERNFRAGGERAAMGISSGAQGAMTYAARQPGLFRYVGSFSGVISILSPGVPALLMYTNTRAGTNATDIWGDPVVNRSNWAAHDPTSLLSRLKGTQVHVSAGNGKPGPFDPEGKAPWDIRYLSEGQVERTTKDFVARAQRLGVPVSANLYGEGSHSWGYWKREMHAQFPVAMKALGARRS
ncbi:alpha/beta hydrolase [Actinomadura flavalba]|uniref:alpha/beta hydrolase n=1 Tax=Actinomadura flavalba TaxID=1120938 RepID=UPI0003A88201|nr:alpha/beta hydrolase family protein [Actinomadura flavalba]